MRAHVTLLGGALITALLWACASDGTAPPSPTPAALPAPTGSVGVKPSVKVPSCTPGGDGTYVDALYDDLARYCLVAIENGEIATLAGTVLSYDLSTPSFSDYAIKRRTVWMPPGTSAKYSATEVFDFPVGTIFTKSFGFPRDPNVATSPLRWVETRIFARAADGWHGASYVWNDAQTAAAMQPGGAVRDFDVRATDGTVQHASYLVPSLQQCTKCHSEDAVTMPIGPRASTLGKDQLAQWTKIGILSGAPAVPAASPPAWNDESAPIEARARQYLAANCAYCHNAKGEARTTGLFLGAGETDPARLGRCKPPVAAGEATGTLSFDVVPGAPDDSILVHRMMATEPPIAMPEIGRSVVHKEGVALIRQWITGLAANADAGAPPCE